MATHALPLEGRATTSPAGGGGAGALELGAPGLVAEPVMPLVSPAVALEEIEAVALETATAALDDLDLVEVARDPVQTDEDGRTRWEGVPLPRRISRVREEA